MLVTERRKWYIGFGIVLIFFVALLIIVQNKLVLDFLAWSEYWLQSEYMTVFNVSIHYYVISRAWAYALYIGVFSSGNSTIFCS